VRRRIGRRPIFFAVVAVVVLLLVPVTPAEFRALNYGMAGLAGFWSLMMALESLAGRGRGERGAGLS
jgi:hypothetical protein